MSFERAPYEQAYAAVRKFTSVPAMLRWRTQETPNGEAFLYPKGDDWKSLTWNDVQELTDACAAGLRALGLQDGEGVAILSNTRVEWILADLGVLAAGGVTSTIYPSNTKEECAYIVSDSGSVVVFAEDEGQVDKLLAVRDQMPSLRHIVSFDGQGSGDGFVVAWQDLLAKGRAWSAAHPGELDRIVAALTPEHMATLIYTSGTTGKPKGVMLTHDCWLYEGEGIEAVKIMSPSDRQYLWLPLAHSFGKVLQTIHIRLGFSTAIDGRIDRILPNLAVVKPTFMAAVPRIFEKVYNKVVEGAKEGGALKWRIFQWALAVGREVSEKKQKGERIGNRLGLKQQIAHRLVFSKLQERFGGRLRFFVSGSAPLNREIALFFHACDMLILEGYGLTESSAATFCNFTEAYRFGTVGHAFPGTDVKLDPADNEILIKGRGIMRGYHNLPEATAESLQDGWLRTGDIGEVDADGYLRITDRKKDLIKTSGGKYIAPQKLEGLLKLEHPAIGQVVVHGDRRNFCSALIAMDPEALEKWAKDHSKDFHFERMTKDPELQAELQAALDRLNKGLASYETVKKFAVLPKPLTIEDGDLTPSQKLKRKAVEKKYQTVLDGFYAGAVEGA